MATVLTRQIGKCTHTHTLNLNGLSNLLNWKSLNQCTNSQCCLTFIWQGDTFTKTCMKICKCICELKHKQCTQTVHVALSQTHFVHTTCMTSTCEPHFPLHWCGWMTALALFHMHDVNLQFLFQNTFLLFNDYFSECSLNTFDHNQ